MLHVVIDDSRQLLLPDLEAVDVDVVLDVLERAPVAVDGRLELRQPQHQLALLRFRVEYEAVVKRRRHALHELLAYSVFEQLLGVDLM